MHKPGWVSVLSGVSLLLSGGLLVSRAQDPVAAQTSVDSLQIPADANCSFFGPEHDKLVKAGLKARGIQTQGSTHSLSKLTDEVVRSLGYVPPGSPTYGFQQSQDSGSIDSYIQADWKANGITPAPPTTDWEFVRRVTLDLTGRIPNSSDVLTFVASTDPQKRSKLIDQLLASPQWVDKWTMFYGDLFKNTVTQPSTSLNRFAQGRNAFYQYIHDSLANAKPYNQMATELLTASAPSSYTDGPSNWILNGWSSTGPVQDTTDGMTAAVSDVFLGITHVNCLLCHNGRGHLDSISLWGANTTRYQAWQLSSYLSHTALVRTPVDPTNNNVYYWSEQDGIKGYTTDYQLNTTSGNRPARVAPAGCKSGQPCYSVPPTYIFNGDTPKPGEVYRAALARDVTGDFQFARAAVNYLWAYFFGQGIVDPPDTFDPARLDPNNPPPAPWVLQPTNAKLLNALATHFVQNGYNVKETMREIVNSQTYQLSSRYNGTWNEAWQPYFARKMVRRLWSEELHDGIVISSGTFPSYSMTGFTDATGGYPKFSYAMQAPDVVTSFGTDSQAGNAGTLLDAFLRGNRDDQPRKQDGSIIQALTLLNGGFLESRLQVTGATQSNLIVQHLTQSNSDLVNTLFLAILSRYPSTTESTNAIAAITSNTNRNSAIQDLVWALYNKVDFIYNY